MKIKDPTALLISYVFLVWSFIIYLSGLMFSFYIWIAGALIWYFSAFRDTRITSLFTNNFDLVSYVAIETTKREAGKVEVNIAQTHDVLKAAREVLRKLPERDRERWLNIGSQNDIIKIHHDNHSQTTD